MEVPSPLTGERDWGGREERSSGTGFGRFWKVWEGFGRFRKVLDSFWKVLEGFGRFWTTQLIKKIDFSRDSSRDSTKDS